MGNLDYANVAYTETKYFIENIRLQREWHHYSAEVLEVLPRLLTASFEYGRSGDSKPTKSVILQENIMLEPFQGIESA